MRIKSEGRAAFAPADCRECGGELSNPACGWYHVYTFQAQPPPEGQPVDAEVWLDEDCRRERLALALIDIGEFQFAPLSGAALSRIAQIMDFFRRNRKQVLLRIVYDTQGRGLEREPPTLARIKEHMEQIGEAVGPYLGDILVVQGIFVGSWGEMHGSKFLDTESMCELVNTLYRVTRGRCFLAVRTPSQRRAITGSPKVRRETARRLGLFNDGIFGSPTDLGTYAALPGAGRGEKWSRSEELEWQDLQMGAVPNGGEILSCHPLKSFRQAEQDLRRMHLSYLNGVYHPEQLEHWRKEIVEEAGCWHGLSGYDYIGRHLGYRFTVVNVAKALGKGLRITVKNNGFGNLCQEADCFLGLETGQGGISWQRLDADARKWKSGHETVLGAEIPRTCSAGSKLYLTLRRRSDGCVLRFANQGAGDSVLLGEFR